jgi:hypothetical protein
MGIWCCLLPMSTTWVWLGTYSCVVESCLLVMQCGWWSRWEQFRNHGKLKLWRSLTNHVSILLLPLFSVHTVNLRIWDKIEKAMHSARSKHGSCGPGCNCLQCCCYCHQSLSEENADFLITCNGAQRGERRGWWMPNEFMLLSVLEKRGKFEDVKSQIIGFGISCIQPRVLGSCKLLLVWIIL